MKIINDKKDEWNSTNRNFKVQNYKGIPLKQIDRGYGKARARRFTMNHTNQNVWIPCKHLEPDGTIKSNEDIDYVFTKSKKQLRRAGLDIKFVQKDSPPLWWEK